MHRRSHSRAPIAAVVLALAGMASTGLASASAAAPNGRQSASRVQLTSNLLSYLKQRHFRVNPGYPILYSKDAATTCRKYTFPALNTCFGANPAAPYVIPVVKAWPSEYVIRSQTTTFGPVRRGYTPTYRLYPREALVIYGRMPPPGRYFGIQTWQWSERGHWSDSTFKEWAAAPIQPIPLSLLFSTMPPPNPSSNRVWSFSALGDNINNVVMQRRSGYPFGKNRFIIITPSATTDRAVRSALHAQGVPDRFIFTQQIPSRDSQGRIGPLGMRKGAIDFNTFFRYAVPNDPDAGDAWRTQLPLTVLRVKAPASRGPVKRYGRLVAGKRTARSELYLAANLQKLVDAVCDQTTSTLRLTSADCAQPPPVSSQMVDVVRDLDDGNWTGPYCRSVHMNCDGDNSDTTFFYSNALPLDSGQVYAAVGTLETETRNATYVGLSVNDAASLYTPSNVLDTMLKGSADVYANTVQNTGKFFVHYYARDCTPINALPGGAQSCTAITNEMVPPRGDPAALGDPALQGMFLLGMRGYVLPGSTLGAESSKLLNPRVLTFSAP